MLDIPLYYDFNLDYWPIIIVCDKWGFKLIAPFTYTFLYELSRPNLGERDSLIIRSVYRLQI